MNQDDRKTLAAVYEGLAQQKGELEALQSSLEDRISNMEEAFPGGCPAIEALEEQRDAVGEAIDDLDSAMTSLEAL
jgi:prefoldin subunit 5